MDCRVLKTEALVRGMNQSLDGYVDHMAFAPSPTLFRHFIEEVRGQAGSVYGRQMYEVMRYLDDDHPEWDAEEQAIRPRDQCLGSIVAGNPSSTVTFQFSLADSTLM
jgi:hypothetical protein